MQHNKYYEKHCTTTKINPKSQYLLNHFMKLHLHQPQCAFIYNIVLVHSLNSPSKLNNQCKNHHHLQINHKSPITFLVKETYKSESHTKSYKPNLLKYFF